MYINRSLFLFSPNVIRHLPTPCVIWAWWTSSAEKEGDFETSTSRTRPRAKRVHPGQTGTGSLGRRQLLPGLLSPLILHPAVLQWSKLAERALIQQKQTTQMKALGLNIEWFSNTALICPVFFTTIPDGDSGESANRCHVNQ